MLDQSKQQLKLSLFELSMIAMVAVLVMFIYSTAHAASTDNELMHFENNPVSLKNAASQHPQKFITP